MSPAETIFFAALAKADPAERTSYLDKACGADLVLRRRVDRLLAAHPKLGDFLEQAAVESKPPGTAASSQEVAAPPARPASDLPEQSGAIIGPYKLLEQIGEGGMGTVWMAQQTEPVKRVIAAKLIKAGMGSKQF